MIFQLVLGIGLLPITIYTWIETAKDRSVENIGAGLYSLFFTIIMIVFYYRIFRNYMRLYGEKKSKSPES